ncbi:MAG: nucleotidyltransferase family protein [Beijerinckiaceae bacterium]
MNVLDNIKAELRRLKPEIEGRYPLRLVSVFGSFVRGEQTDQSDIDVLAEKTRERVSLFDIINAEKSLAQHLGRRVDLRLTTEIKPRILSHILREAQPL